MSTQIHWGKFIFMYGFIWFPFTSYMYTYNRSDEVMIACPVVLCSHTMLHYNYRCLMSYIMIVLITCFCLIAICNSVPTDKQSLQWYLYGFLFWRLVWREGTKLGGLGQCYKLCGFKPVNALAALYFYTAVQY